VFNAELLIVFADGFRAVGYSDNAETVVRAFEWLELIGDRNDPRRTSSSG
jgi:hypothetical protein